MKKTTIYISVLSAIFIALLLITGFTWYGREADDISQGEKLLEEMMDTDFNYKGEIRGIDAYHYEDENDASYLVDKEDGLVVCYVNSDARNHGEEEIADLDDNQLIEIAEKEIKALCPKFYDYKVVYSIKDVNSDCIVEAKQYTFADNYTGNHAQIRITKFGTIYEVQIHNREDASIADNTPAISESEAIEIAYEASKVCMEELAQEMINDEEKGREKTEDDEAIYNDLGELVEDTEDVEMPPLEVYLDDRSEHVVIVSRSVHKGRQIYIVQIFNVENNLLGMDMYGNKMTMQMVVTIDANTGEVISAGHGA